ncbi:hypothetical protein VIGAN_06266400 [Vigna angularis var. angularis]|uniref:Uncharacterized protein n=1 Tax=Vigna angularis var. angularis TaxID=157739 RepID=A0A0S3SEX9_PHAAN|nr:hypothetical protein VIGAN_06266400 [Vigna angularis var. angularis]
MMYFFRKPCRITNVIFPEHNRRSCKCCCNLCRNFRARMVPANGVGCSGGVHVFRSLPAVMIGIRVTNLCKHYSRDACGFQKILRAPTNSVQRVFKISTHEFSELYYTPRQHRR